MSFNYPTAAAAASDLGGIERARKIAAMTIGLGTITFNPKARVVIMAAGEGKASVIRAGVEDEASPSHPSSVLHSMPNARFYVTHGAASKLTQRKEESISRISQEALQWAIRHLSGNTNVSFSQQPNPLSASYGASSDVCLVDPPADYLLLESCVYSASIRTKKAVHMLEVTDMIALPEFSRCLPSWLVRGASHANETSSNSDGGLTFRTICACASRRLKEKIEGGLRGSSPTSSRVLHTAPHHDDIMLSYHGAMHDMLGRQPVGKPAPPSINAPGGGGSVQMVDDHYGLSSGGSSAYSAPGSYSAYPANRLGERYNGNLNHFAYLTSGFHSVEDSFLLNQVCGVLLPVKTVTGAPSVFLEEAVLTGQLNREYDDIMSEFRASFAARDFAWQDRIEHIIFLRKVAEVWSIPVTQAYNQLAGKLRERVVWIKDEYLAHHQAGDAVPKEMQLLKGCMRETEVDRVWALSSMPMARIHHMRSK